MGNSAPFATIGGRRGTIGGGSCCVVDAGGSDGLGGGRSGVVEDGTLIVVYGGALHSIKWRIRVGVKKVPRRPWVIALRIRNRRGRLHLESGVDSGSREVEGYGLNGVLLKNDGARISRRRVSRYTKKKIL